MDIFVNSVLEAKQLRAEAKSFLVLRERFVAQKPTGTTWRDLSYVQCVVFENAIKGGKWFARIKHGTWMVALCCPLCAETFERGPHPYIRRIETLEFMSQSRPEPPA